MKLKSRHLAPLILVVFVAGIGGTMAFNLWKTEGSKIPVKFKSGEYAGEYNPADIRGSYAFSDISEIFEIPLEDLSKAFRLESVERAAQFQCKELEGLYGELKEGEIGTDAVKLFVALYTGLPYKPEETTRLPAPALSVLREKLSQEALREVEKKTVSLSDLKPASFQDAEEHLGDQVREVRGMTTFGDLKEWGLTKEAIEQALGIPLGKPGVTVRDYCAANGIEFSGVKTALHALLGDGNQ